MAVVINRRRISYSNQKSTRSWIAFPSRPLYNRAMPSTPEASLRYPGWRIAAAASACVFVSFASLLVYTFGIFLKPLANEFGWSREAVSAAFGFAALAVAACSPPLGWLLD